MLTEATFSAFSGYTRHTRTSRAAFHRCKCLFYVHLPRQGSGHSAQQALYSPVSSLRRLNFAFSGASLEGHLHQRTRRRGRPNADFPNHECFRAHHSRSGSGCDSLRQAKTTWVRDGHIASFSLHFLDSLKYIDHHGPSIIHVPTMPPAIPQLRSWSRSLSRRLFAY